MRVTGSAETAGEADGLARGAAWLVAQQDPDGFFRDFATYAGASDEWVTAYVCETLLCSAPQERVRSVAFEALKKLALRQRPDGSWGYNATVPGDCDSTAWSLLAFSCSGWRPSPLERACAFLLRERREDGAFATYGEPDAIARFIEEPRRELLRGWTKGHACVSAVVLLALARSLPRPSRDALAPSAAWLRSARQGDGTWPAYWWAGWAYATLQALRALAATGVSIEAEARAAADLALESGADDGGFGPTWGEASEPFATALALQVLLLGPEAHHRRRALAAAHWLLEHQAPDGHWESAPILRIPEPFILAPWTVTSWRMDELGTGVQVRDGACVFTTATALRALRVASAVRP